MHSTAATCALALVVFVSVLEAGSTLRTGADGRAGDVTGPLILDIAIDAGVGRLGRSAQAGQGVEAPSLASALAAAGQYVVEFRDRLSGIVAEERYRQRASTPQNVRGAFERQSQRRQNHRRELRSDFLLVRPENTDRFVEYRDVFEVDGRSVRDRQERLANLFLNHSRSAQAQAGAITIESARHNVGTITRTLNTPTLALVFLSPDYQPRVAFSRTTASTPSLDLEEGEWGDSTDVWTIEFAEGGMDTLVRGPRGASLAAQGRFWIEPASGVVVASELIVDGPDVYALVDVRYALEPDIGVRVPVEMREQYRDRYGSRAEGTATYSNFRRFQVQVEESAPFRD